jgi:hypothetical protein
MWRRMGQRHMSAAGSLGTTVVSDALRASSHFASGQPSRHQTTVGFNAWRKSLETRYLNGVQTHL